LSILAKLPVAPERAEPKIVEPTDAARAGK
jgi:hypothetical protein